MSASNTPTYRSLDFTSGDNTMSQQQKRQQQQGPPGDSFIRTAWVRRSGTDAFSSLPVHVKPEYTTVADILLAAHKLLYTTRDSVTPSDVELVIDQSQSVANSMNKDNHIPVSNLDTLEVLAAFRKREIQKERERIVEEEMTRQQADGGSGSLSSDHFQLNSSATKALIAANSLSKKTESEKLAAQLQQNNSSKSKLVLGSSSAVGDHGSNSIPQGPVDIFLILRRRHRAGGGYATASLVDAVLMDDPKVTQDRNTRNATPHQTVKRIRTTTPTMTLKSPSSATRATTPGSTRASRLRKELHQTTPTKATPSKQQDTNINTETPQGRALADAQKANQALFPNGVHHSSSNTIFSPTSSSSARQQPTVVPVLSSSSPSASSSLHPQRHHHHLDRRASPTRQEAEDAVLQCREFAPQWLKESYCDFCNRPKRLHTVEAIKIWENKAKRHQSPSIAKKDLSRLTFNRNATNDKPLWKPKKVTPKVNPEVNPLSCDEFIPVWGREQFCTKCNGLKEGHSRAAMQAYVEKHKEAGIQDRQWHTQRPFPTSSFEERREHRTVATASRCEAFVPLWNHNDFCAICFQPEIAHPIEKRYFNFPQLSIHDHHRAGGYLTNQHFSNPAVARNFWIATFPWRVVVSFLPLDDLFSLASAERWLLVELRPLMKSTLTLIAQNGVTAHYDLRNDAVRVSSHLEACSDEVKSLLSKVMDVYFVRSSDNNDHDDQNKVSDSSSPSHSSPSPHQNNNQNKQQFLTTSCESILSGGTVGSRSALLRRVSRIFLGDEEESITKKRSSILADLKKLEEMLLLYKPEDVINEGVGSAGDANRNHHFQSMHAHAVVTELVRILKRVEFQHETCRKARRYLNQELVPL